MNRRKFISGLAGAAGVLPRRALGQPRRRPQVVVVSLGVIVQEGVPSFIQGLTETGLLENRDFDLVVRSAAGDATRATEIAGEVVALNPAVIVSTSTGLTLALKKATSTIPIVGVLVTDPVGLGLIESYSRPGGNVTGIAAEASTPGKLLELLLETVPGVRRVGGLFNPANPGNVFAKDQLLGDAKVMSITLVPVAATVESDIEPAFQELARERVGALVLAQDAIFITQKVASLALAAGLPSINGFRNYAAAGGLLSYGSSLAERWHRSGHYAARILRGEKPGDLPFEQPPKLQLVINLSTARSLGIVIPQSVLVRADEIIDGT
jgi:putative tryptophan/tyrosine transport system substrate-binding protein